MILSLFYCIVLLLLLCRKFGIAENYALFGVKIVSPKFGWCKENDIFHVWYNLHCTVYTVHCTLYTVLPRYPLELHLVHRNIHDDTVEEALEHENGITVLGFKFKIVDDESVSEGRVIYQVHYINAAGKMLSVPVEKI